MKQMTDERLNEIRALQEEWYDAAVGKPHRMQPHWATTYAGELLAEVDRLRATPPATPAPAAAGEAGELPLLTELLMLRGQVASKEELLRVTEAKLANATKVAEDAFQEAARLQQELAEAEGFRQQVEGVLRQEFADAEGRGMTLFTVRMVLEKVAYKLDFHCLAPAQTPPPATPEAREAGGEAWVAAKDGRAYCDPTSRFKAEDMARILEERTGMSYSVCRYNRDMDADD